jgi:hypothetical protein
LADLPDPVESTKPQRIPRYYVLRVHTTTGTGEPGVVSVTAGPFLEFGNAWYSALPRRVRAQREIVDRAVLSLKYAPLPF